MKRFSNYDDTILDNEGEQLINTDEIVDKLNELDMKWRDKDSEIYHLQESIHELTGFDRVDYVIYLIMKYNRENSNDDVKKLLNRFLNDLDTPLPKVIEYSRKFDNPDGYKYKYFDLKEKYAHLEYLIEKQINYCEAGIQQIIDGDKDSYIVKHDIAIGLLKQLLREIKL